MWLKKAIPILVSIWILEGVAWYTDNENKRVISNDFWKIEQTDKLRQNNLETIDVSDIHKTADSIKNQIFVCLNTDEEGSFMHTKALETIDNPENTVLEFPLSQLFQTYWNRKHPLYVWWVSKNFQALVWANWIETNIPQWFSSHMWEVTNKTAYLIDDTLRFSLMHPDLKDCFPESLVDQLKEPGFEWFSNSEDFISSNGEVENIESCYDIVVKRILHEKYALALYKNWRVFMTTYVSVWLNSRKTKRWQFKTMGAYPYYYSHKYKSPMPYWIKFDEWWFFFHQWNVTGNPASHWCVRMPGVNVSVLYSLVKNKPNTDVFIDENLYITKK